MVPKEDRSRLYVSRVCSHENAHVYEHIRIHKTAQQTIWIITQIWNGQMNARDTHEVRVLQSHDYEWGTVQKDHVIKEEKL